MLFDVARRIPEAIALDDLTRTRTFAALVDRAQRAAHGFASLGAGSDGHVAILAGNRVEVIEVAIACVLGGQWLTAVNWHLTADEAAFILEDSDARVVVTDPEHEPVARAAAARCPHPPTVVVLGDGYETLLADSSDSPFDLGGESGGTMLYTSGTTGRPKGVKRARRATLEQQLAALAIGGVPLGLDGQGPHLVTGPLYHAAPLGFALMDLYNGAPMVILPRWDERACLAAIASRGVTTTHLVPTMFVRLLRLPDDERAAFDPSGLVTVLHGAAPIAPSTKVGMIAWWGPILREYWGGSEGGVVTLVDSGDWLDHPGTVGRAIGGHEVFAVDDDLAPLPAGETGLLYARHPTGARVFSYHGDDAKTDASELAPGVYTLGDIGRVDADGWVYLSDRASHMIISGGVNIYPAEIEQTLIEHPAVGDVAVFGVPDDEWGENVQAVVEPVVGVDGSPALAEELRAYCRDRLAGFKVPKAIDFTEELPRHPTGKLFTRLLRDQYVARATAAPDGSTGHR